MNNDSASESTNCTYEMVAKKNSENPQLPRSNQSRRMKKESLKMATYMTERCESFRFLVQEQLLRGEDDVRCENCGEVCHIRRKTIICWGNPRNITQENTIKEGGYL